MPEMDGYYVEPGTTLFLFEGVPIDNSYEHSIWWAKGDTAKGRSDQFNFFISTYKHYDFEKQYYQRYEKGTLRVNMLSDDIMCCNYMIFANEPFSDRYYYAFITQIEYSANNVATIYYDLDYIQTFYFDFKLLPCFIDREHDAFDEMYGNLVSEDLDLGTNYVQTGDVEVFDMNDQGWALLCSCDEEGKTPNGSISTFKIADNMAVCANLYAEAFDSLQLEDNGDIHNNYGIGFFGDSGYAIYLWKYSSSAIAKTLEMIVESGKTENIIALYQYPTTFGDPTDAERESALEDPDFLCRTDLGFTKKKSFYRQDAGTTGVEPLGLDGYVPLNNKLYTYPYTYLLASNNLGDLKKYYWEDFYVFHRSSATNYVNFDITLALYPTAVTLAYPTNHRGIENDYDEGLVYDKFPQVPFSYDGFTAWWGNNRAQTTISIGTSLLSTGTRAIVGEMQEGAYSMIKGAGERNLVSGLANVASQIASVVGKISDMKDSRPTSNFQSEEQLNLISGKCQYSFYCMTIRHQQAEILDQYFSRYGYATHKVKVPNTHARLNWTYVKTLGCALSGILPTDARKAIEGIFNNGITFWTDGASVGDYTLDNTPIGIEGEGDDI